MEWDWSSLGKWTIAGIGLAIGFVTVTIILGVVATCLKAAEKAVAK